MMRHLRLIGVLARKDLRLLRRDWGTLFFIAAFPVIMGLLFGMIGGSFSAGPDAGSPAMRIGVVDNDQSDVSKRFVADFDAIDQIEIEPVERSAGIERVRKGELLAVLIIPEEFGETAGVMWLDQPEIELGVDPSRGAERAMLEGFLMQASGQLLMSRFQDLDTMRSLIRQSQEQAQQNVPLLLQPLLLRMLDSIDAVMVQVDAIADADGEGDDESAFGMELVQIRPIDVTRQTATGEGDAAEGPRPRTAWDISFPSAILWGVLGCVAGFATSVVQERTRGTLFRLQVAPANLGHVLAGKALACFLTVLLVIFAMTLLGLTLGISLDSVGLLALAAVCVAFCFVGIMMTFSVIGRTEEVVGGASWGANVVMAMFGGGMFPLAFMPGWMSTLANFSPVKWGIVAIEGAVWRGYSLADMLPACAVLIGIGAVGLLVGITILRRSAGQG